MACSSLRHSRWKLALNGLLSAECSSAAKTSFMQSSILLDICFHPEVSRADVFCTNTEIAGSKHSWIVWFQLMHKRCNARARLLAMKPLSRRALL